MTGRRVSPFPQLRPRWMPRESPAGVARPAAKASSGAGRSSTGSMILMAGAVASAIRSLLRVDLAISAESLLRCLTARNCEPDRLDPDATAYRLNLAAPKRSALSHHLATPAAFPRLPYDQRSQDQLRAAPLARDRSLPYAGKPLLVTSAVPTVAISTNSRLDPPPALRCRDARLALGRSRSG